MTLDIFAGRESVRGQTGGLEPVVLTDATGATLSVPAGALAEDTAISFVGSGFSRIGTLSSFLPATPALTPLAEFVVDLSGRTLGMPATLDAPVSALVGAELARPAPGDTLLIARVERIAAIPRPAVVALASVVNDHVVTQTVPGLPGLVRGGRYVLYRATDPVGFVAGTTRLSDGTGTRAVVETEGLPFIGTAGATAGQYLVAARAGQTTVTAKVTGTSLVGTGSVEVPVVIPPYVAPNFSSASLDLTLAGAVTTATVTPIDGSVAVSVTAQVEIQSTASIDPATVTPANVRLFKLGVAPDFSPALMAARLILSGSGRTLALVPTARLDPDARFRLDAANLTDTTGGLIVVPTVTFTTKADVPPTYDTRKLVFGMPDVNGFVTFTGPAGTLPPGTQVLVVNAGSGEVASFTADNDGAIGGSLLASIQDRLLVTITDPLGNVITFERGEYRAPDGTTAVNTAGGIVTDASCSAGPACGGVELRIPPDAVEDAVVMQLKALALSLLPEGPLPDLELPDGQVAQLASALEIKSDGTPTFNQPVDLVFPKPATAPEGASYFVVRRLTGPDGLIAYETVDVAKVEGEGADAKVVTASEPFSGYLYTQPGFSLTGLDPSGAMGTQFVNTAILYWAFDEALPGRPLGGAITGRALRVTWNPGSSVPEYEPVAGAMCMAPVRIDGAFCPALTGSRDRFAVGCRV